MILKDGLYETSKSILTEAKNEVYHLQMANEHLGDAIHKCKKNSKDYHQTMMKYHNSMSGHYNWMSKHHHPQFQDLADFHDDSLIAHQYAKDGEDVGPIAP